MLEFLNQIFISTVIFFDNLSNVNPLECISIKRQECKVRPEIININFIFYPFSIKINKCTGNCNNINNPHAKICVPDVIKDLNKKLFNLMPKNNETRLIKRHEKCKHKRRLDAIICNNQQRWNKNKCRR